VSFQPPTFAGDPVELVIKARRLAVDIARIASGDGPTSAELANAPTIDLWRFATRTTPGIIGFTGASRQQPSMIGPLYAFTPDSYVRAFDGFYRLGRPIPADTADWRRR
jgi:hypothetical protein